MNSITVRRLAAILLVLLLPVELRAQQERYTRVVEGILGAWKTADVVCLGEGHGRYNDSELRIALVRHPAFPRTVRVVVVEMANGIHQDLLDRFILDGAAMSRDQIAPIWRDASSPDVWETPIYEEFLRAIHDVNLKLPRDQRVRVIAGDAAVDWSKITKPEELVPFMNRGGTIRTIIATQVLDKNLKGLAIYGSGHCAKVGMGFPGDLSTRYPISRFWSIYPLTRNTRPNRPAVMAGLDTTPEYIVVKGSAWEMTAGTIAPPPLNTRPTGQLMDAIAYHGRADSIVRTDMDVFRAAMGPELDRRAKILLDAGKITDKQNARPPAAKPHQRN